MRNAFRYALIVVLASIITLVVVRYVHGPDSGAAPGGSEDNRHVEELSQKVDELTRANAELVKAAAQRAASTTTLPGVSTDASVEHASVAASVPAAANTPVKVLTPTGESLPPRGEGLGGARAEPVAIEGGLGASVRFTPTDDKPLGIVAIVAELPATTSSQILSFGPADTNGFSEAVSAIRRQGRFAIFHAQADRLKGLDLRISVTAPVTVTIRGTAGIGPLSLELGPGRASVVR